MAYTDGSYRWAAGWIVPASLTTTYEIKAFTKQTDQPRGMKWFYPHGRSSVYDEVAEVVDSLGGYAYGYGGAEFTWELGPLSPNMYQYIVTNLFASAWSAKVTVMTWDRSYGWRTLWCIASRDKASAAAEPGGVRGFLSVKIRFLVKYRAMEHNPDEFNTSEFS